MTPLRTLALPVLLLAVPLAGRPISSVRHILIVSVDGLRPDLLAGPEAPNIRTLMRRGAHTLRARTIAEGYTLPSHVSMLTGVTPSRHGVTWNSHIEEAYPAVPALFELAKTCGLTTAMAAGKTKFIVMEKPGTLDWSYRADETQETDLDVARQAVAMIRDHQPGVLFVHFAGVDIAGHASGWGSLEQLRALERADQAFGLVEQALAAARMTDSTFIILTADHGGTGLAHPPEDPLSQFIPWIAAGPSVRRDFDLDTVPGLSVSTMSTFATVCAILGIEAREPLDGSPVLDILEAR